MLVLKYYEEFLPSTVNFLWQIRTTESFIRTRNVGRLVLIHTGEPFLPYVTAVKKIDIFPFGKSGMFPNIHTLWFSFLQPEYVF